VESGFPWVTGGVLFIQIVFYYSFIIFPATIVFKNPKYSSWADDVKMRDEWKFFRSVLLRDSYFCFSQEAEWTLNPREI
jgi:hypothetical protein